MSKRHKNALKVATLPIPPICAVILRVREGGDGRKRETAHARLKLSLSLVVYIYELWPAATSEPFGDQCSQFTTVRLRGLLVILSLYSRLNSLHRYIDSPNCLLRF